MKAHLLYESPKGENRTTLLGLVVDPADLAALQGDGDTMPVGGYLLEVDAIESKDGAWYVLGIAELKGPVQVYTVAAGAAKEQRKAAALAKLSAEDKEALGLAVDLKAAEPVKGGAK